MVKNMTPERNIVRYRRRSRVFHWLHSLAFVILLLTGLAQLIHQTPSAAFHRVIIVHLAAAARGTVTITFNAGGARAYAFTFGG